MEGSEKRLKKYTVVLHLQQHLRALLPEPVYDRLFLCCACHVIKFTLTVSGPVILLSICMFFCGCLNCGLKLVFLWLKKYIFSVFPFVKFVLLLYLGSGFHGLKFPCSSFSLVFTVYHCKAERDCHLRN